MRVSELRPKSLWAILLLAGTATSAAAQRPFEEPQRETEHVDMPARNSNDAVRPDGGGIVYEQWLLVATGESVPNANPVSVPSYGDTSASCTYSQSTLSLLPCYNPLKIVFDVVLPANFTLSTNSASPTTIPIATLSGTGPSNLLVLTNSVDSTDGGVSSISGTAYCTGTQIVVNITVTNEDSSVFHFTNGTATSIPCTLTGVISGSLSSSTTGDTGSFTIATQAIISGTYQGNLTDSGVSFGTLGNSQLVVTVNSDFTASGSVSVAANSLCSAQTSVLTLSSTGTLAQANGVEPGIAGISVGDSLELAASNSTTLIWFVASDDNLLGVTLATGAIFVTGYVVSGTCAGTYFYDAPFQLNTNGVWHRPPIGQPPAHHHLAMVHAPWRLAFRD
jgi:hypothetical protein